MNHDIIAFAIPVFLLMIGIEYFVASKQGKKVYRLNDSIADFGCGIFQQVFVVFIKAMLVGVYAYIFQSFSLFEFTASLWVPWVIGILGVDFGFYWYHRMGHRVNFAWAMHIVHHQSQDYNLAVALRQAAFSPFLKWVFIFPLAFLGVSPVVVMASAAISTLYQFWIHTETIGKLGRFEWLFNCPSHHRVHHAVNPKYIDKNYAGIFILWDRMFGTFIDEDENEKPFYGTVKQFKSWNPIWANLHYWVELRQKSKEYSFLDQVKIWFKPPEWRPKSHGGNEIVPEVTDEKRIKWDIPFSKATQIYTSFHFVLIIMATTSFLYFAKMVTLLDLLFPAVLICLTLIVWSGVFEKKSWAKSFEFIRLLAFSIWAIFTLSEFDSGYLVTLAVSLLWPIYFFWTYQNQKGFQVSEARES